jgi:homoserine O-acetyltransferase
MIVEKKTFELPSLLTTDGKLIKNIRVGWESYGTLNADKSNAILITHYFSGTSHAAGKYAESDALAGYWDGLIGPGKSIDTNRFFVLSSDTLVNLNARDPRVVTTGPTSLDPETGKPYGLTFPLVSIRDFVEVQKHLIDSLGITKLQAVMGPSMGGLQTLCWGAAYPDRMERIIPVICSGEIDAYLVAWLGLWAAPILADPAWKQGAYGPDDQPIQGLTLALRLITLHANHWLWTDAQFGRAFAVESASPAAALAHRFKAETAIEEMAAARAAISDANHLLYLVKANQCFEVDLAAITAKCLLLYAPDDQVFRTDSVLATAQAIAQGGASIETAIIEGPYGHLNGVLALTPLGEKIAKFLET